jgi:hypothetical protein
MNEMSTSRPRSSAALHWDGRALIGTAASKAVTVTVPARLVSFRHEEFPPAPPEALKAAVRMRAERAFAPLGPVAIEALIAPLTNGRCGALLLALPRTTLDAIRQAALTQGRTLAAVRVAELLVSVPTGGLVTVEGETSLVVVADGAVRNLATLGTTTADGLPARLARERQRLSVDATMAGAPAAGITLDFLHPTLNAPPALMARPGVRIAALATGIAAVLVLWATLTVNDALAGRAEAQATAERLRPLAKALADKRADLKEVAPWLDARPSLAPGLNALTQALPALGADDQVRLTRVRQSPGEDAVAEGHAGDRAQMMAFLDRLRRDPRVAFAEIRASRSTSKESRTVVFELVFRLADADKEKATTEKKTVPTAEGAEQKAGKISVPTNAPTSRLPSSLRPPRPLRLALSFFMHGASHAEA